MNAQEQLIAVAVTVYVAVGLVFAGWVVDACDDPKAMLGAIWPAALLIYFGNWLRDRRRRH